MKFSKALFVLFSLTHLFIASILADSNETLNVDSNAYEIIFDEYSFPQDLLESASYSIVDGLPDDFLWGTATAAYQVEGATNVDGIGQSNWDKFSHEPGRIFHNDNGDVADDDYHLFKADIKICADIGFTSYRFSLSWSRIMPTGESPVNQAGIDHYNAVIDAILENNLVPVVTLYHWDLPMALEKNYGGWLSEKMVNVYTAYAEECFKAFGDRVKYWLTFNEPWSFVVSGYNSGNFPPGRCSDRNVCEEGDSSTEPYIAAHNVLNSHSKAAAVYLDKYEATQKGEVGITLNSDWAVPLTDSEEDKAAAQRFLEFQLGWFADPVYKGKYPQSMVDRLKDRLPSFSEEQMDLLIRTKPTFFGLNHYSSYYAADKFAAIGLKGQALKDAWEKEWEKNPGSWSTDYDAVLTSIDTCGKPIGPTGASAWLHVHPEGFRSILNWVYSRYNTAIIVTENGVDVPYEADIGLPFALRDPFRINYYRAYIESMNAAAKVDKVKVRGYFAWSLLDNFEWADGYSKRFGIIYVDYQSLKRYPKASSAWIGRLIRKYNQRYVASSSLEATDWASNKAYVAACFVAVACLGIIAAILGCGVVAKSQRSKRHAHTLHSRRTLSGTVLIGENEMRLYSIVG